jgi:mycofactocin precursor
MAPDSTIERDQEPDLAVTQESPVVEDVLVEEVSIDGMCGVY